MNRIGFPYVFSPELYKNAIAKLYNKSKFKMSREASIVNVYLSVLSADFYFYSDPVFYVTLVSMLLLGCRISEVQTINVRKIDDDVFINVYSIKQSTWRQYQLRSADYDYYLNKMFDGNFRTCNEKEFNRRFKKIYPDLKKTAKFLKINEGSHIARHVHTCTAHFVCDVPIKELMSFLKWKFESTALKYLSMVTRFV